MDENKKEQFNRIDELLKDTSAENRIKFNEDEAIDILSEQEDKSAELEEAVVSGIEANPIAEDEHNDENSSDSVCIIDETSTTLELTNSAEAYQSIADGAPAKKHREKVKFNALQIVLMCVVGVALLWCIVTPLPLKATPLFFACKLSHMRTVVQASRVLATRFNSGLIQAEI